MRKARADTLLFMAANGRFSDTDTKARLLLRTRPAASADATTVQHTKHIGSGKAD